MRFSGMFKFLKKKVKKTAKSKINKKSKKKAKGKEKLIAKATHYFPKIKVAVLKLKSQLKKSDKIHIKGYTTDFIQIVTSMQIDHKPINMAKKDQEVGLLVKKRIRHNDKIYKVFDIK